MLNSQIRAMGNYESKLMISVLEMPSFKNYSINTQKCYSDWIFRFLVYHSNNEPSHYGKKEIADFLCFLKNECNYAATTINAAFSAISFLYKEVLKIDVHDFCLHHYCAFKIPVILKPEEIKSILSNLRFEKWLMASILYGSGLRLSECVNLRVSNIDLQHQKILVNYGVRNNPRITILPRSIHSSLQHHLEKLRLQHQDNLKIKNFFGTLINDSSLPEGVKFSKDFNWLYLFPSDRLQIHKPTGKLIQCPRSCSYLQKAVKLAAREAGIQKNATCHSFRHSFAFHLIEHGCDIHIVQKLMGHKDIQTTMAYIHIKDSNEYEIESPLDRILHHEVNEPDNLIS